jgi:hypothetical protein
VEHGVHAEDTHACDPLHKSVEPVPHIALHCRFSAGKGRNIPASAAETPFRDLPLPP